MSKYGKTPDAYVLVKLNEKKIQVEASFEEKRLALETLEQTCAGIETEVEAAKKVLEEAEKRLALANKEKETAGIKLCMKKGEIFGVNDEIEMLKFKMMINETQQKEKKLASLAKKNMPNGVYSEPILEKVVKLPEVIVNMIGEYLPISVHNNLLSDNLFGKINNIGNLDMKKKFFSIMLRNPMYLTILTREEARSKIEFIGGVKNPTYRYRTTSELLDLQHVKKELYNFIVLAKARNPVFASKILKTMAVLNTRKFTVNKIRANRLLMSFLTEQDLPAQYL